MRHIFGSLGIEGFMSCLRIDGYLQSQTETYGRYRSPSEAYYLVT